MEHNIAFGIIISLLFILLLVLFCVLIVKLYINKVKNYTKLIYQKDIDFQKSLNTAMVETQEQVLNNISRDLHDDAGQQITYINFQLENLKLDNPEVKSQLEPLSVSLQQLSESVRSISHSLNNQLVLQQDLVKVIGTEAERLSRNPKVKINFKVEGKQEKSFSQEEKIIIYRIFQEIVNNCLKHAKATVIDISILFEPYFNMCVSDNGRGFDYEQIKENTTSLGITNMINRAAIINYKLSINSEIGKGTKVVLTVK